MKGKLSIFWILLTAIPTVVFTAVGILIRVYLGETPDGLPLYSFPSMIMVGTARTP